MKRKLLVVITSLKIASLYQVENETDFAMKLVEAEEFWNHIFSED